MGLRTNPSQRQRRFGYELRKLRETSGLRAEEAGERAQLTGAHLRHIEGGRTAIPDEKLRLLLELYGCIRQPYVDSLLALHQATGRGWWHAFRKDVSAHARDLAEIESMSPRFVSFEPLHIPGLLQTAKYMQALIEATHPENPPEYTARGQEFRLQRQELLSGSGAPTYHAIIHEAAFHMRFVDTETLKDQILHLIDTARLQHITVQIVPFRSVGVPAVGTPCVYFNGMAPELSTVYLEHDVGSIFLNEPDHLARYSHIFQRLEESALAPIAHEAERGSYADRDSLSLLQHLLYTL